MTLSTKQGFVGLVTAIGDIAAPQGALRTADNVHLRRIGALSSRDAFVSGAPMDRAYRDAIPYQNGYVYFVAGNGVYNNNQTPVLYSLRNNSGASAQTPTHVRADIHDAEEARGNLYVASIEGSMKLTSNTATAYTRAGLIPGIVGVAALYSGGAGWLPAGQQVAYRLVARQTQASNGLVVSSRPTGQIIYQNVGGIAVNVGMTINVGTINTTGLEIEVYRTRAFPNTVTPDDEMQLVAVLPGTTGDQNFIDTVPETARTRTLYTSPSRGGMESANDIPPGHACVELFRGSLFYGNIQGPQRAVVSFKYGVRTGSATGFGLRTANGDVTNGSSAILNVSNTTGLVAGQYVGANGFTAASTPPVITSVVGTTVNVSVPAFGTYPATGLFFYDTVIVDGQRVPLLSNSSTPPLLEKSAFYGSLSGYEVSPPEPGYTNTMVFERRSPNSGAFTIAAGTNSADTSIATLGTITSKGDVWPHGLAWSNPDEPEHVPVKNYARVGDQGKAILALTATREALYIFKEDGVFRLTGIYPSFRIDPFDTTCLCVLPMSVRRLRNTVYLLSSLGIAAVEDSGVRIVSQPIQTEIAKRVREIRRAWRTTGLYQLTGFSGRPSTTDEANGEYLLVLGTPALSFGGEVLVYSSTTGGFTTYSNFGAAVVALARESAGVPLFLTATQRLEFADAHATSFPIRVATHSFSDPQVVGKMWTHAVIGLSQLLGGSTAPTLSVRFSSSEPLGSPAPEIVETVPLPSAGGTTLLATGALLRHPVPRTLSRAWALRLDLTLTLQANGACVLELLGAESRENIPNKMPNHATGAT